MSWMVSSGDIVGNISCGLWKFINIPSYRHMHSIFFFSTNFNAIHKNIVWFLLLLFFRRSKLCFCCCFSIFPYIQYSSLIQNHLCILPIHISSFIYNISSVCRPTQNNAFVLVLIFFGTYIYNIFDVLRNSEFKM